MYTALALTTAVFLSLHAIVVGQESKPKSPSVAFAKDLKVKLKAESVFTVFLTGNDSTLVRIAEDALAIHLSNAGFAVISREKLEKTAGEQVDKSRKENKSAAINALDVSRTLNADYVITGTVLLEFGEQKTALVRVASFQVLDIATGQALIQMLLEPEKGDPISLVAARFVEVLK